jgi:hypothetical protein
VVDPAVQFGVTFPIPPCMPRLSRRRFVSWMGAVAAALGVPRHVWARAAAPGPRRLTDDHAPQASPLDDGLLVALAAAVLPTELGDDGSRRAARAFAAWAGGYKAGAELLHGYGSAELRSTPPLPLDAWRRQLAALDADARQLHRAGFAGVGAGDRQALVRQALRGVRVAGMPAPAGATHVAVALLAHFYDSPGATDLCYRARIGRTQCRPLGTSSQRPLPLAGPR